jgi:hypothetical protein
LTSDDVGSSPLEDAPGVGATGVAAAVDVAVLWFWFFGFLPAFPFFLGPVAVVVVVVGSGGGG